MRIVAVIATQIHRSGKKISAMSGRSHTADAKIEMVRKNRAKLKKKKSAPRQDVRVTRL
jgi:hypothetical protein